MLQSLMVKNFAIIDNVNLDFFDGFTAITGETGAGKSLLIDAIGLLLGNRASASMVRHGESKAIIEGVFSNLGVATKNILESLDILDDDLLIIRKEIHNNGKSLVRVNGYTITMSQLDEIASTLADIHTQNDTKKLFDPKNYLLFIDDNESHELLKEYQKLRSEYLDNLKKYDETLNNIETYQKEKDYLEFQYQTLVDANLKSGELEQLTEEIKIMNHYEMIFKNLSQIKNEFVGNNITNSLYSIINDLEKISDIDKNYQELLKIVKNSYYELTDIESVIGQKLNHLEFDNDRFEELNDRINYLKNLTYKYRKSIEELIVFRDDLKQKINLLSDDKYLIDTMKSKVDESYLITLDKAVELSKLRKTKAKILTENIMKALNDLMLDKVRINIEFTTNLKNEKSFNTFGKNGIDVVNFLISFNPGEELKDLSKIASGGEMSRVMLALKTHLLSNLELATMIFDEIDSGVSGEVAYEVAKKMKEIANYTQVLAITHLPIVASMADNHLYIAKKVENGVTSTIIRQLNSDERINVLAKLISPNDLTGNALELAKQMLNNK